MKWLRYLFQFIIGGILLTAAIGKLLDNRYATHLIAQWQILSEGEFLLGLVLLLSLSELVLAVWLFAGWHLAKAALAALAFHFLYTVVTVFTLLRGIQLPDCACFGILYAHALNWVMAAEDFGFTVMSLVLLFLARQEGESSASSR